MNEAALPQSTVHIAQADPDGILLVIHAGAGNRGKKDTPERRAQVEQDLNRALEAGYALLEQPEIERGVQRLAEALKSLA